MGYLKSFEINLEVTWKSFGKKNICSCFGNSMCDFRFLHTRCEIFSENAMKRDILRAVYNWIIGNKIIIAEMRANIMDYDYKFKGHVQ